MTDHTSATPRSPGDSRYEDIYLPDEEGRIDLALSIAEATGRPLLVIGPSGGGKSTLAAYAARKFERRYLEVVMTARTTVDDLLYQVDMLERLADANQTGDAPRKRVTDIHNYLKPGALWWAFDPKGAAATGVNPPVDPIGAGKPHGPAVLLIDEIDKAEPDVPDALLVPLGSLGFTVPPNGTPVRWKEKPPLLIITSNQERELSRPFMRRCLVLELKAPNRRRMEKILGKHLPPGEDDWVITPVLDAVYRLGETLPDDMSAAEVIDIAKAAAGLPRGTKLTDILEFVTGQKQTAAAQER